MIVFAIIDREEVVQEVSVGKSKVAALFTDVKAAEAALKKLEGNDLKVQAYRAGKTVVV